MEEVFFIFHCMNDNCKWSYRYRSYPSMIHCPKCRSSNIMVEMCED